MKKMIVNFFVIVAAISGLIVLMWNRAPEPTHAERMERLHERIATIEGFKDIDAPWVDGTWIMISETPEPLPWLNIGRVMIVKSDTQAIAACLVPSNFICRPGQPVKFRRICYGDPTSGMTEEVYLNILLSNP